MGPACKLVTPVGLGEFSGRPGLRTRVTPGWDLGGVLSRARPATVMGRGQVIRQPSTPLESWRIYVLFNFIYSLPAHPAWPPGRCRSLPPVTLTFLKFLFLQLVPPARDRGGGRRRAARPVPCDKSLDRGLTFNRSQQVSCSATHETLTQNQVVYE